MQNLSSLQNEVKQWDDVLRDIEDTRDLVEMSIGAVSEAEVAEFTAETERLQQKLERMAFLVALSGKHDRDDAVISISAGAGGTESQDWAEMLLRMYLRWAETRGYRTELLDQLDGEGAGLKSVTFSVQGDYAYGYAQAEHGVHRLVRISPFDSANRRHTSFALVEAKKQAQGFNQPAVAPEHILWALLEYPTVRLEKIFQVLAVDASRLRLALDQMTTLGRQAEPTDEIIFTKAGDDTIAAAGMMAYKLGALELAPEHLLLGVLQAGNKITQTACAEVELRYETVYAQLAPARISEPVPPVPEPEAFMPADVKPERVSFVPSPVFALLLLATGVTGYLCYQPAYASEIMVFLFVTLGWIVTLSLHEFAHALVAYLEGDWSVANKGYLSLNPLKYTQSFLSIVLPVIFLAMGGIGLPGGAVYIQIDRIKKPWMRSLISAAGPSATAVCAVILLIPFMLGLSQTEMVTHLHFWSALGLLAFLQVTALFFNLLPLPGLDGFGIIAPFLPKNVHRAFMRFGTFTFLIIFVLFFYSTPVSRVFWAGISFAIEAFNLSYLLVGTGFDFYQFWN